MDGAVKNPPMPLIGIPCCQRMLGEFAFHVVNEKYITAALDAAGGLPLLIPALGTRLPLEEIVDRLDGLLLTGSPSNVEPHRYGGPASVPGTEHDPARDDTTLPLIGLALAAGLPMLGLCRGLQEMNVALGGTLHQKIHKIPGRMDHRGAKEGTPDYKYRPVHPVALTAGGLFESLAETGTFEVNSLHSQGVDRLAEDLTVEAVAPDGQIEAFRAEHAPAFTVGVQWHPEFNAVQDPFSKALFRAFGLACRERAARRRERRVA